MAITTTSSGLEDHGLDPERRVYWDPTTSLLYTHALARGEASLAEGGPLVVETGRHTGRSVKDKFFVREPGSEDRIAWGDVNQPLSEEHFEGLREKVVEHLNGSDLYVVNAFVGADPTHRINVRLVTDSPWHALFGKTLFIDPEEGELLEFHPDAVILHAPGVEADPDEDGTRSETFIVLHPSRGEVLIGGTEYAGEIKKSVFTVMNDRLPLEGVLPMHCSANIDDHGRVAIFFGLSGTGKTTLSADPERRLIGDDEHGWGDEGVFNFEGGCYAKVIRLSRDAEPEIYRAVHAFGTVLENVVVDERGVMDLNDDSKTENTPAAYKLELIENTLPEKRAGTEIGVTEPQPTFSCAFGAPFLPQRPTVYAEMLGEKLDDHGASVWLVNTGWTGGPYGEGQRMPIAATRALLRAALNGALDDVEYRTDPIFGFDVPAEVPGVEPALLDPRSTWRDPEAYDEKARYLATRFKENFEKFGADENIVAAGPRV